MRKGTAGSAFLRACMVASLVLTVVPAAPARAAGDVASSIGDRRSLTDIRISSKSSSLHVPAGMRLLARFRASATAAERAEAVRSVGGWIDAEIVPLGVVRIALPGDASDAFGDGPAVAALLAQHPAVEFAELDGSVRLTFDPNDQHYRNDPYVQLGQWGIRKAFVDKAWDTVRGAPSVIVAVLDTGIDAAHPDLSGALVPGNTFVTQPSSECTAGMTVDDNSHGTHVAGIVGAIANNAQGIAGVAFGVKVMPLKVLDCTGLGSLSDVANGLVWAVDQGARVVNLSLGSPFDSQTLRSAITHAQQKNVLVVSASGNCGTTGERCTSLNQVEYPAAYPEVLAVGATDTDDSLAFFSSRNATVDVAAPGRRIVSTTPTYATYLSRRTTNPATLTYAAFSGTSQAAPFVAGLAALVWSGEPSLSAPAVIERIRSTADDLGDPGRDDGFGSGRVNALKAVAQSGEQYGVVYDTSGLPTAAAAGKAFAARVTVTNRSSFAWRSANPNAVRLEWSWLGVSGQAVPGLAGVMPLPADLAVGASAQLSGSITAPAAPAGYTLRLDLVRDAIAAFSARGATPALLGVTVGSGIGASYAPVAQTTSFDAGATTSINVVVTNTGTVPWPAGGSNPVKLSYHWLKVPPGGSTASEVVTWEGLRAALPGDAPPGARVTLALPVLPPAQPGTYTLRIELVQEGVSWFSGLGVAPQDLVAPVRSAYVATYAVGSPPVLLPGGRATLPVTVKNTGSVPWTSSGANPVRLAAHVTDAKGATVAWDGIRTALSADVAPGAQVATSIAVDGPTTPGSYRIHVDLVREGVAWFSGLGVATGDVDLLVAADYRAELPTAPLTVSRARPVVDVTVKNIGIATWTLGGPSPVTLSAHWYDAAGNVLVWDGPRTALAAAVAPGATVTIPVQLGTPPAGAVFVTIDPVSEGIRWFGAGLRRAVTLAP